MPFKNIELSKDGFTHTPFREKKEANIYLTDSAYLTFAYRILFLSFKF